MLNLWISIMFWKDQIHANTSKYIYFQKNYYLIRSNQNDLHFFNINKVTGQHSTLSFVTLLHSTSAGHLEVYDTIVILELGRKENAVQL